MQGVVQLVRTPYSHREQQIVKEISTAVAARGDVEIAVNSLRMELAVGSIESHPPATNKNPNHAMFSGRVSSSGMCFVPKMNTRMWSGIPRLCYKGFAGSKVPVRSDDQGREVIHHVSRQIRWARASVR